MQLNLQCIQNGIGVNMKHNFRSFRRKKQQKQLKKSNNQKEEYKKWHLVLVNRILNILFCSRGSTKFNWEFTFNEFERVSIYMDVCMSAWVRSALLLAEWHYLRLAYANQSEVIRALETV